MKGREELNGALGVSMPHSNHQPDIGGLLRRDRTTLALHRDLGHCAICWKDVCVGADTPQTYPIRKMPHRRRGRFYLDCAVPGIRGDKWATAACVETM